MTSKVGAGQVEHRSCGKRFRVRDGLLARGTFVYARPFCGGAVASQVHTGEVNHRSACGDRFYVWDGSVNAAQKSCGQHAWPDESG